MVNVVGLTLFVKVVAFFMFWSFGVIGGLNSFFSPPSFICYLLLTKIVNVYERKRTLERERESIINCNLFDLNN